MAVRNGLIAVAVENAVKTLPGLVAFFDANLNFLAQVEVGALPDMLTFTPNGRWLLVANEGEPNPEYSIDPEGSVSVIDLSGDVTRLNASKVRTADFKAFNHATLDPGIRIFGPGASVAQDLEPEYIAVSHDSKTAWITCQENNALAIIDAFEGIDPITGRYRFVAHTDRGPNAEPTGSNGESLVLERDDDKISTDAPEKIEKKEPRHGVFRSTICLWRSLVFDLGCRRTNGFRQRRRSRTSHRPGFP